MFKININKKASQEMTIQKIITIILILLVLIAAIMILIKPGVLEWIKNLPSYSTPEDKTIDVSNLSPEQVALLGCDYLIKLGDIDSSRIQKLGGYEVRKIIVVVYNKGVPSSSKVLPVLTIDTKNQRDYVLEVIDSGIFRFKNLEVGHVQNGLLTILPDILNNYQDTKYSRLNSAVQLEDLKILDGAYLMTNKLELCKKNTQ